MDSAIRERLLTEGAVKLANELGVSQSAVLYHAKQIGAIASKRGALGARRVKGSGARAFTPEEDAWILEHYSKVAASGVAAKLGISSGTALKRVRALGIPVRPKDKSLPVNWRTY